MKPVIIIGAGGYARVLADALRTAGARVLGFTDRDPALSESTVDGLRVLGSDDVLAGFSRDDVLLVNGVGSVGLPSARRAIGERLLAAGWCFSTVVHPRATVSERAHLEEGAQVMAGAVVQPGARIRSCAIVNTGAVVDHDCDVGAYVHVAPGATLSGGVVVGEGSHVGTGAVVVQGVHLGPNTLVAAGAVVIRSDVGGATLMGMPARRTET